MRAGTRKTCKSLDFGSSKLPPSEISAVEFIEALDVIRAGEPDILALKGDKFRLMIRWCASIRSSLD